MQPGITVLPQTPAVQASAVQALPSVQSASVAQGTQPGIGVDGSQMPPVQDSVVQALPSAQLRGVPATQPAAPPQVSLPVQASPSSQSASPPSSTRPLQSLSTPSHSSGVRVTSVAVPTSSIAFVPLTVATLVK